ncbi:beta-lactamase-like protein [Rhizodiscina lignyota]|uniref:Beta-lactamase-like protein n=1 Tax=Rhizodiscina lignyota TaxID=1504668 RepID=A0A9P4MCU4_9PEZI|nr:beta-lactamase-like protein [Rhizodiscina lignyota]
MSQNSLNFDDTTDFENATRGCIGKLEPCIVKSSNGRVVWNNEDYNFLQAECPPTAQRSLWRQGQLAAKHGLFEVTQGVYQVRGLDISNMTIIEGAEGVVIVDPLISVECAEAALSLYRKHRGARQVSGLIYTHSHVDHFGGAAGILRGGVENVDRVPIIAPEGFMKEVMSENVTAGPAMLRRAAYMYGSLIPRGPNGQIGCGLGQAASSGMNSIVPPTRDITHTGEELVIDGIQFVFQLTPDTEAPAELNFYLPQRRALCIAECATHCLHNVLTLRGALVRDARRWSRYLDEAISLFGRDVDVLFAGHHWPTWGRKEVIKLIGEQRDLYAYLHDQTVRMMNAGMTGTEIAEVLELPPTLKRAWHAQGYYGSVSHNVKAIYQRYMGWFDGNPARLWEHPPKEAAERYVECMGGIDEVIRKAETYTAKGDLRFAATLLGHAVTIQPADKNARMALAAVYEQLGYGSENATWRNFYLSGAQDLRAGPTKPMSRNAGLSKLSPHLQVDQLLDALCVQLDGQRAGEQSLCINVEITEEERRWRLRLANGAFTYRSTSELSEPAEPARFSFTVRNRREFIDVITLKRDLRDVDKSGDETLLPTLSSLFGMQMPSAPASHI